ncbi:MAG TPA: HDIG domain-containing protein [Fimbriimonadaceae bacterium]|nr:HDIG domain-containing protein [Fimbriimonadaceae bacterium]
MKTGDDLHPALAAIAAATLGTAFEGDLWLVGGAVRDELLGRPSKNDFDLVTRGSSADLARMLFDKGVSPIAPVIYERFGTAMVEAGEVKIEIVTARRESYESESRKPNVEAATLEEDARRRDFTVNALLRNLHTGELFDPLGRGLSDLRAAVLRTPLDPSETFHDDPLRMLRAVRFRWQLGFDPAHGLYESIRSESHRLKIISAERIRDELIRMLGLAHAADALCDLMNLSLIHQFAPEFEAMRGVDQGHFHHLDVWDHTLLVVANAGNSDPILSLGALFHDIGKPTTRSVDREGHIRFFSHETVGAAMTNEILRRLKFPQRDVDAVALLVKNHMRLGSSPEFTPTAARRLLRDLGDEVERLLDLVEADANGLRPGVKVMDLAPIRRRLEEVRQATPRTSLESPLTGEDIMALLRIEAGPEVGRWKSFLTEKVIEGVLAPGDKQSARRILAQARTSWG